MEKRVAKGNVEALERVLLRKSAIEEEQRNIIEVIKAHQGSARELAVKLSQRGDWDEDCEVFDINSEEGVWTVARDEEGFKLLKGFEVYKADESLGIIHLDLVYGGYIEDSLFEKLTDKAQKIAVLLGYEKEIEGDIFQRIKINDNINGYWIAERLSAEQVPKGFFKYELRYGDELPGPSTIENDVAVDFGGSLLVDNELFDSGVEYVNIRNVERFPEDTVICCKGKKEGPGWRTYWENGNIRTHEEYHNGVKDGEYKCFYENGTLKVICNFEHGKLHGEWLEIHENGQVAVKEKYFKGELHGRQVDWDEEGKEIRNRVFFHGKELKTKRERKGVNRFKI